VEHEMRIKIVLDSTGGQSINLNYNHSLTSFIYTLLRDSDEEYASFLHDDGYKFDGKKYKMFTFSMLIPEKYTIINNNIVMYGKVIFYISSPMKEFLMNLVSGITALDEVKISSGVFKVISVEVVKEPQYSDAMRFKCLSPVTISTAVLQEDKRLRKYNLYIEDKQFVQGLKSNILSKYKILNGDYPNDDRFEVRFFNIEKYKKGKLINYKDGIKIKGYLAPFEIYGNPELIKTAYECGLGDSNSLGMGMIEVDKK